MQFCINFAADGEIHSYVLATFIFISNQHYLSFYRSNFDQTFWTQIFEVLIFGDQHFFSPKVEICAYHYSPNLQPPTHSKSSENCDQSSASLEFV